MVPTSPDQITALIHAWCAGDRGALRRLVPLVYAELRRLAHRARRGEGDRGPHTTTLVHEAYLRLCGAQLSLRDRAHFFAVTARVMRRLLCDEARARNARKRSPLTLEPPGGGPPLDVIALDEALRRLSALDPRQGRLVELRFFGGLTEEEAAQVLQISVATLKRDWTLARAWLFRALGGDEGKDP